MTYELAKQLKDAGFPQKQLKLVDAYEQALEKEQVYIPSLSELIEACADKFDSLCRNRRGLLGHEFVVWIAYHSDSATQTGDGKTPEEAVAKLWLALNAS